MVTPQNPFVVKDALIQFVLEVDNAASGYNSRIGANNPIVGDQGRFFFGQIRNFTPPPLRLKSAPWPTVGDGQLKVDLGVEEMPFSFTTMRYSPGIRGLYGKVIRVTLSTGLWRGDNRSFSKYQIIATGPVEQVEGSQVTAGEVPDGITVMLNCHQYKELGPSRNDANSMIPFVEIDIERRMRKIDGVDQLEALYEFFGLSP